MGGLVLEAEATEGLDALQRSRAVDLEQVALAKAFDAPVGDVRKTGEAIGGTGARLFAKARKARDTGLFAVDGALGPLGDLDRSAFFAAAWTTAMAMVVAVVVIAVTVHGTFNDAAEDAANDATEEGLTGGGGLNGRGLGGLDDVEVGVVLSLDHGLCTGEAGEIKAGHVDGGLDEQLTGLPREAVVVEGSGLSVGGDGQEG